MFLDFATVASDDLEVSRLSDVLPDIAYFDHTPATDVVARIADAEFVFVNKVRITEEILRAAPKVRFIGLIATGIDNIDVKAARNLGVAVCNIRGYCTQSIVEHVFAMLLYFSHSVGLYRASVRRGEWRKADNFCMLQHPVRELSDLTIGIVGHGTLGSAVANMARHFNMRVLIARRPGANAAIEDERTDFSELLQTSDVVSLHCPLTSDNRNLISGNEFELMKPTSILINTARGGLVDSTALVAALTNGRIAAAAIDVLREEPPVHGDPLLDYDGDNLVVTPHIAWATVRARQNAINELAANVVAFINGEKRNRLA